MAYQRYSNVVLSNWLDGLSRAFESVQWDLLKRLDELVDVFQSSIFEAGQWREILRSKMGLPRKIIKQEL
jgi:hypothetical protein